MIPDLGNFHLPKKALNALTEILDEASVVTSDFIVQGLACPLI